MPRTYVALDLETTGLDPSRDAIIEIGAVRFDRDEVVERFSTFVNPGRKIPLFIIELTGITDAHVADAIGVREASRRVADFVGRDPVVGHNVRFDLSFLRKQRILQGNPSIDTFELAGILVPHANRYSLVNLVKELDVDLADQAHRALDDAEMTHRLFMALMDRASALPQSTLKEIVRLGQQIRWGATRFFSNALYTRQRYGFQGGIGAQLAARRGGDAAGPLFVEEDEIHPPLNPRKEPRPIDLLALTSYLAPDGPIAASYPTYEYRDQQVEMMQAVGEAFNHGEHLMVEAGTGTGKSLAYLLPAVEWAVANKQRVVISTNTINLQEQLANKDIPQLTQALYEFRAQVLKGRSHYLCRHQFESLRRRGPSSEDEMRVLAKVMLWLPNTLEGDGDALFIPTPGERRVWYTISAANEGCDPEHCRFFHSDTCFFYRARAKAEAAHLVIVNHALLLADVAAQNRVLPEYELLIVDEAHHLERATTESLRFSVSWQDLGRAFDSLLRPGRSHPSLLDEVAAAVERLPRNTSMRARQMIVNMRDAAHRVQGHLESLFTDVEILLNDQASGSSRYGTRLRITEELRHTPKWEDLAALWSHLAPSFDDLVDDLSRLGDGLEDLVDVEAPELENVRVRLLGATRTLATAKGELESFIKSPDENGIYWLESRYRGPMTVNAVPLHVGPLVQEHLFAKKRSIVLTSATLQIENSFDYLRERLGMGRDAMELAVGSPFDYPEVALLYVVSDIPEPGTQGYQKNVEETLIELLQATDGRALVLFTSYSQLRATTEAITTPLAHEGITVYAQGTGTSRAQLLESFRTGERVVLMGTRSFWEGVDVTGEALSCLVIVKLPFDVPNDPIVASRAEMYENAFNDYMVPEAVLRFLQGFGRLIRTAKDQGIAVVLDRRILTKRYGRRFVDSLPDPRLFQGTKADLPAVARRWLAGQPLPSTMSAISEDEPWVVPPPEEPPDDDDEPPWFWGA